jgi:hypothetical protein
MSYLVQEYENFRSVEGSRCTFLHPQVDLSNFRHRAACSVLECEALLEDSQNTGGRTPSIHMMSLVAAARAYGDYFVLQSFVDAVLRIRDCRSRSTLKRPLIFWHSLLSRASLRVALAASSKIRTFPSSSSGKFGLMFTISCKHSSLKLLGSQMHGIPPMRICCLH